MTIRRSDVMARALGRARVFVALAATALALLATNPANGQKVTLLDGNPPHSNGFQQVDFPTGISDDGRVIVGYTYWDISRPTYLFIWTENDGYILHTQTAPDPYYSLDNFYLAQKIITVSADGSTVVGTIYDDAGNPRAFRFNVSSRVLQYIGGNDSAAYDVSADGSVVVGSDGGRAFRWTQSTGMQYLTNSGTPRRYASAVSPDGNTVVGFNGSRVFRWTASSGNQVIFQGVPIEVSADGNTVLGVNTENVPVRWLQGTGLRLLTGSNITSGFFIPGDMSLDGNTIIGSHYNGGGFRWRSSIGEDDINTTYLCEITLEANLKGYYSASVVSTGGMSWDGRFVAGAMYLYGASYAGNLPFILDTQASPNCQPHNGDVNEDNVVDDADLLAILFNFGADPRSLPCEDRRSDVNCDGIVDDADLLTVLFNFGSGS